MERQIGEIFEYNDEDTIVKLKVIEQSPEMDCEDCYFSKYPVNEWKCANLIFSQLGYCCEYFRDDKRHVIFKQI